VAPVFQGEIASARPPVPPRSSSGPLQDLQMSCKIIWNVNGHSFHCLKRTANVTRRHVPAPFLAGDAKAESRHPRG